MRRTIAVLFASALLVAACNEKPEVPKPAPAPVTVVKHKKHVAPVVPHKKPVVPVPLPKPRPATAPTKRCPNVFPLFSHRVTKCYQR